MIRLLIIYLVYYVAVRIRHKGVYSVYCVLIICSSDNITVLGSRQVFTDRVLLIFFLLDALHFNVRQRIQKKYQILDVYPRIILTSKGLSIFQKLHVQCDSIKVIWFSINRN